MAQYINTVRQVGNHVTHHISPLDSYKEVSANPLSSGETISIGLTTRERDERFSSTVLFLPLEEAHFLAKELNAAIATQELKALNA